MSNSPTTALSMDQLTALMLPMLALTAIVLLALMCVRNNQKRNTTPPSSLQPEQPQPKPEPRDYTESEVAEHASEEDLWLIIDGKVYDFTQYFLLHPGGESILRNAGRDSTEGFKGPQHPARVWDMVSTLFSAGRLTF